MMLGNGELLLVLAIAMILFGPERLPELARQLGEAVRQAREALEGKGLGG